MSLRQRISPPLGQRAGMRLLTPLPLPPPPLPLPLLLPLPLPLLLLLPLPLLLLPPLLLPLILRLHCPTRRSRTGSACWARPQKA